MKLYTEEQVKSAFIIGMRENYIDEQNVQNFADSAIKYITPIELPSDDEIEKALPDGFPHSDGYQAGKICGFEEGAKWMKEQILNQNKNLC